MCMIKSGVASSVFRPKFLNKWTENCEVIGYWLGRGLKNFRNSDTKPSTPLSQKRLNILNCVQAGYWKLSPTSIKCRERLSTLWRCDGGWNVYRSCTIDSTVNGVSPFKFTKIKQACFNENFRWKLFDHSPYGLNLAPSDCFIFFHLKQFLGG